MPEESIMSENSKLLEGKKALISGGGRGIGRSIALAFAENGADVAIVSRTRVDVQSTAEEIETKFPGAKVVTIAADISTREGSEGVVQTAKSSLSGLDVLVCAAGYPLVAEMWEKSLHELQEDDLRHVFETDVIGSFRLVKDAIPVMMEQERGVIILFSSTPAIAGYGKGGAYTVSKAANLGLAKEIAAGYGKYNIRAYAIAPGNIMTDRTYNSLSQEEREALASEAAMKRWGKPEEVAEVAVVLASERMAFVTGQTLIVDGGTVMV